MVKENNQNCVTEALPCKVEKTFLLKVQLSSIFFKSAFYLGTQHLELSFLLASWSNKIFFFMTALKLTTFQ